MCAVSAMGDHYSKRWDEWVQKPTTYPGGPVPIWPVPTGIKVTPPAPVTREEFDALKREVEEMKRVLMVAADYDRRTEQPHCEVEDKVVVLKKIAEYFGVDLKEVFDD